LEEEKTTRRVFVDSENLWGVQKDTGVKVDQIKLSKFLAEGRSTQIFYFFSPREISQKETSEERGFLDYLYFLFDEYREELEKVGIPVKIFPARSSVDVKIISSIAQTLLREKDKIGEIVLVSGDGGFAEVLELAKEEGIKVKVVAGKESCSKRLKNIADETLFIEDLIEEHSELILRPSSH
jgi:uncharacterized LabA/DUF88 family protein